MPTYEELMARTVGNFGPTIFIGAYSAITRYEDHYTRYLRGINNSHIAGAFYAKFSKTLPAVVCFSYRKVRLLLWYGEYLVFLNEQRESSFYITPKEEIKWTRAVREQLNSVLPWGYRVGVRLGEAVLKRERKVLCPFPKHGEYLLANEAGELKALDNLSTLIGPKLDPDF